MTYVRWPLFDLRLAAPDLTLRQMREADLATVAAMLPEDAEQDPRATRYAVADARRSRGIIAHQFLLGRLGNLAAPLPRQPRLARLSASRSSRPPTTRSFARSARSRS